MIRNFISLVKPGIIFGNLITVCGAFFLASRGDVNYYSLVYLILSVFFIVGSGCVFNNIIDVDIDKLMDRTKDRVLVRGLISKHHAFIYGCILAIIGVFILYYTLNRLTLFICLAGFFVYVFIYSLWLKRSSSLGVIIGSISGSLPPVIGYCSVSNKLNLESLILFSILTFWQMPHFYAISIFRYDDYLKAKIPVLAIRKGLEYTKYCMLIYIILFFLANYLLYYFSYAGKIFLLASVFLCLYWICLWFKGLNNLNNVKWAKSMFFLSVIILSILSIIMSFDFVSY